MIRRKATLAALFLLPAMSSTHISADEGSYISGSIGYNNQDDSNNQGVFTSDFTTGQVTGVNPPLNIPAGAAVGWNTQLDSGIGYSLAYGWYLPQMRLELEYAVSDADVTSHTGVNAAGLDLGAIDAGVLIAGNVGDLGVSVADLVADGRGEIESDTLYINGLYDFGDGSGFTPYVGLGLGYSSVDVLYAPSGVGIIDSDDTVFAYQLIVGASLDINDSTKAFGNIRYRKSSDVSVSSTLLPASFDVENESIVLDIGVRFGL